MFFRYFFHSLTIHFASSVSDPKQRILFRKLRKYFLMNWVNHSRLSKIKHSFVVLN